MTKVAVRERGGMELLAELERAGAITPTALDLDPSTSYDRWSALGGFLGLVHRSACWLIGDWINFGERVYGEKYAQAVEATGLAEQTLMNYASIARRVPPERRRESLSFTAHAVVAALEPAEQDAWLDRATEQGWSRRELEAALREESTAAVDPPPDVKELARAVWLAARKTSKGYLVPEEPMRALREALL